MRIDNTSDYLTVYQTTCVFKSGGMAADSRRQTLESILRWSLRQQDNEQPSTTPMDAEQQAWLKEALEAISSAPSETDLLKAALSVLRAHEIPPMGCDIGEDTKNTLVKAFDEVIYFIEDLDHAKDLITLGGLPVMLSYFNHPNRELCAKACVVVGTAAQNNEACQKACQPALAQLIDICKSSDDSLVKVKSLYAVSCIIREFPPATGDFIHHKGMELLLHCLLSDHDKLIIKALFLLTSVSTSISDHVSGDVVMVISQLLMTTGHDQIRRHSAFCLCSLVKTYPNWTLHCPAGLKETIEQNIELLNDPEYEEELAACRELLTLL